MPNENEKLDRFEKAVFSEAEIMSAEILSEVDSYKSEKISNVQDGELQRAYQRIQSKVDDIRSEFARSVTKEKLLAKQQMLLSRKELMEGLFKKAASRLMEFSGTKEYESFLRNLLNEHADMLTDGAVIEVRQADLELIKTFACKTPVEGNPALHLGGIAIRNNGKQLYLDETFESRLENAKEQFYASGKANLNLEEGVE